MKKSIFILVGLAALVAMTLVFIFSGFYGVSLCLTGVASAVIANHYIQRFTPGKYKILFQRTAFSIIAIGVLVLNLPSGIFMGILLLLLNIKKNVPLTGDIITRGYTKPINDRLNRLLSNAGVYLTGEISDEEVFSTTGAIEVDPYTGAVATLPTMGKIITPTPATQTITFNATVGVEKFTSDRIRRSKISGVADPKGKGQLKVIQLVAAIFKACLASAEYGLVGLSTIGQSSFTFTINKSLTPADVVEFVGINVYQICKNLNASAGTLRLDINGFDSEGRAFSLENVSIEYNQNVNAADIYQLFFYRALMLDGDILVPIVLSNITDDITFVFTGIDNKLSVETMSIYDPYVQKLIALK